MEIHGNSMERDCLEWLRMLCPIHQSFDQCPNLVKFDLSWISAGHKLARGWLESGPRCVGTML